MSIPEGGTLRGGLKKSIENRIWVYCSHVKKFCATDNNQQIDKETFDDYYRRFLVEDYGDQLPRNNKGEIKAVKTSNWVLDEGLIPIVQAMTYYPNKPKIVKDGSRSCFNLWVDPELPPYKGDINNDPIVCKWIEHINYICSTEQEAEILKDWLAYQVQHPGKKINWSVIIYGPEKGTGKSLIGYLMETLFNGFSGNPETMNAYPVEPEVLNSEFNDYARSQFIFVNEMYSEKGWKSDQIKLINKIKNMITEKWTHIHFKGVDRIRVPNRYNMGLFTNYEDALMIDDNERRFYVIYCDKKAVLDKKGFAETHYQPLWDSLEDKESMQKIKKWFLDRDLSRFSPKSAPPKTEAMEMMARSSKSDLANFMLEAIESCEWPFVGDLVTSKELSKHINSVAKDYGLGNNLTPQRITKELRRIGCKTLTKRYTPYPKFIAVRNFDRWEEEQDKDIVIRQHEFWLAENNKQKDSVPL